MPLTIPVKPLHANVPGCHIGVRSSQQMETGFTVDEGLISNIGEEHGKGQQRNIEIV